MILHIDMDAFFAAIEQRNHIHLQNRPIVISGNSKRSVVSTASYEARKFGIRSAMPVFEAKKKCPELIIVQGSMHKYREESKKIMEILSHFSPVLEQVSIDEAFLDIKGCSRLFGTTEETAASIKKKIYERLSLTCSIGAAPLKFIAKIASDMNKPDGITIIEQAEIDEFIFKLPIGKVPGVGRTAMKNMEALRIRTLGDVQKYSDRLLTLKFGRMGTRLSELSRGIDRSVVETCSERKSISSEMTLAEDINDFQELKKIILDRSQVVGRSLRKKDLLCRNVFIKLKFSDFSQITRSRKLDSPICSSSHIFNQALELYKKVKLNKKIRLVGVGASSLVDKHAPVQMLLINDEKKDPKRWESVDSAVDSISEKFGSYAVKKAALTR